MKTFAKLSLEEERIGKEIVDCAYKVHYNLGPGLLEKIYETCFCHELAKKKISFSRQVVVPVNYDGIIFNECCKVDVLVESKIICELKAVVESNQISIFKLCDFVTWWLA